MESALSTLILFTVGLFAAVTISFTYLQTQDILWTSQQASQEARLEREQTAIDITGAETQNAGSLIRVKVRNTGNIKLSDFERWDVIVEYYSDGEEEVDPDIYEISRLTYTEAIPSPMQWSVSGIYMDANSLTPEAFEPGILNPDEEMVLQLQVTPAVALTTTNRVTIASINGINDSASFVR